MAQTESSSMKIDHNRISVSRIVLKGRVVVGRYIKVELDRYRVGLNLVYEGRPWRFW